MLKESTPVQRKAYYSACVLLAGHAKIWLQGKADCYDRNVKILLAPETQKLFDSTISAAEEACSNRGQEAASPLAIMQNSLFCAFRNKSIKIKSQQKLCKKLIFKSQRHLQAYFHAHHILLKGFSLFDSEAELEFLLNGEEMDCSNRLANAGSQLYTYLVINAIAWQHIGSRGLLTRPRSLPSKPENTLKKFAEVCPLKKAKAFFRKIADFIPSHQLLLAQYDLVVADLPHDVVSSWSIDSSEPDTYENPLIEFLHRIVELLVPGGRALVILPSGLKEAPSFKNFAALYDASIFSVKPCGHPLFFDLWCFTNR